MCPRSGIKKKRPPKKKKKKKKVGQWGYFLILHSKKKFFFKLKKNPGILDCFFSFVFLRAETRDCMECRVLFPFPPSPFFPFFFSPGWSSTGKKKKSRGLPGSCLPLGLYLSALRRRSEF